MEHIHRSVVSKLDLTYSKLVFIWFWVDFVFFDIWARNQNQSFHSQYGNGKNKVIKHLIEPGLFDIPE